MRTSKINGFTFHHNTDFSGNVAVQVSHDAVQNWPDGAVVEIPFLVLAELVGQRMKQEAINEIETESGLEFLGLDTVDDMPEMQDGDDEEDE